MAERGGIASAGATAVPFDGAARMPSRATGPAGRSAQVAMHRLLHHETSRSSGGVAASTGATGAARFAIAFAASPFVIETRWRVPTMLDDMGKFAPTRTIDTPWP